MYVRRKSIWQSKFINGCQVLDKIGKADTGKKIMSGGMEILMDHPVLFNAALWAAPLVESFAAFYQVQ